MTPFSEMSAQAETNAGVARATGVLALGNIASRVLGLAREIVLTNLFGASRAVDAFNYAILVPKTLYDLLIAGHVNSAIIPVLSDVITREGEGAFWRLVSILFSLVTVVISVSALILAAFAPQVIGVISSGSDAPTQAVAAELLRWIAPALVFLSLFAVLSGALYARRSFSLPAFAGAVFNGAVVIGTLVFAPPPQVTPALDGAWVNWTLARPDIGIRAAAFGWLIGALAQLMLQLPGLRGGRLHFTVRWNTPAVRRIGLLYTPVLASLLLDTFVRTFSYNLASQTGVGSVSYMNWATTLIQFPQGLVATAISIAILPTLARQAVLQDAEGAQAFKDTLGLGLRLAITLMIPAAVGLFVLAQPIIRLLFEHGAFTPPMSDITGLALRLYLIGLPFAAVDLLLVYAFYARQDTLTPALIGLVSLVLYTLVAVALLPLIGLFSLMIADSVKHIVHAALSGLILRRRLGGYGDQKLARTVIKTGAAALAMGAAALIAEPMLETAIGSAGVIRETALVALSGGLSVAVFAAAAALLRIDEWSWIIGLIRSRIRG
ncbi:MAG: murein biosynthesis integral membrane protein MurJ [bacterium]|nr:murein biosynthesis integral membrane protein MurJ [bacterium]